MNEIKIAWVKFIILTVITIILITLKITL